MARAIEAELSTTPSGVVDVCLDANGRLLGPNATVGQGIGILRMDGVPIGYLAPTGTTTPIGDAILAVHEAALIDASIRRALIDGTYAATARPDDPATPTAGGTLPAFTIAICTRDRPDDLARCLASIEQIDYPGALEVLVVENAPRTPAAATLVQSSHSRVRYVQEPCPGLNWARRRAVTEARGDILGFVDDDVIVDRAWARTIAAVMVENLDAAAVTGLVVPLELATDAQVRFERLGGLGKGFVRQWHRRPSGVRTAPIYGNMGPLGIGANMAFRRRIFDQIGSFDPALGAGTITGGGDDLDLLFRVLEAGHTLVYEPAAFVRHRHRRDERALVAQMENWSSGMQAFLMRSIHAYPDERVPLMALAARLLLLYYPKRIAQSLIDPWLRPRLAVAELTGAIKGVSRYGRAHRRAKALAAEFGYDVDAGVPPSRAASATAPGTTRVVDLSLDEPLPMTLPGSNTSDMTIVHVTAGGRALGEVTLVDGGHPIGRSRLADALVGQLGRARLDPEHRVGLALRRALTSAPSERSGA